MLKTPLGRLRAIGIVEGLSFLILLGIAMPLKYWADMPLAVTWTGQIHGILFILYVAAIVHATIAVRWSFVYVLFALIAAFVPFGPFIFDRWLKKKEVIVTSK